MMTATTDEVSKAVAAAIKARDSVLRDVIAETTEADRGKLMNICINSIPDKLLFIEGVYLDFRIVENEICRSSQHRV